MGDFANDAMGRGFQEYLDHMNRHHMTEEEKFDKGLIDCTGKIIEPAAVTHPGLKKTLDILASENINAILSLI